MMAEDLLADEFEAQRPRLRAVAYRMLGSVAEAEDAVQEAWVRLSRADSDQIENLAGWLTTVVSRICLNLLRTRNTRREDPLAVLVPDPIVGPEDDADPETEALLADSVGLALMVVLETLGPAERLAFVLHDMFDVPFDDIAAIAGRTSVSVRQLASRARRRVADSGPRPDVDLAGQRRVVDAFFAAARAGDFEALVAVLDPDVIVRTDGGRRRPALTMILEGAAAVASQAVGFRRMGPFLHRVLVNGAAGAAVTPPGQPFAILGFIVRQEKIVAVDVLRDPDRLDHLDLSFLEA